MNDTNSLRFLKALTKDQKFALKALLAGPAPMRAIITSSCEGADRVSRNLKARGLIEAKSLPYKGDPRFPVFHAVLTESGRAHALALQ